MSNKPKSNLALYISGGLTAAICLVMNLLLIPGIEAGTQGIRCFDMNFAYSYEDALKFLSLLTEEGRRVYLTLQLPLDFVYPIVYAAFFILLFNKLLGKKTPLSALPIALAAADYIENVFTIIMLKSTDLSKGLTIFASGATIVKTVLMYHCFLVTAALIIYSVAVKIKCKSSDAKGDKNGKKRNA